MDRQKTKEEVIDALHGVASEMHDKMMKGNPPTMTLPVRSKSNIGFDKKLGVYKYGKKKTVRDCLLYTSPSPRDVEESRMPSSA